MSKGVTVLFFQSARVSDMPHRPDKYCIIDENAFCSTLLNKYYWSKYYYNKL